MHQKTDAFGSSKGRLLYVLYTGGESPGTSTSTAHAQSHATDILEQELGKVLVYVVHNHTLREDFVCAYTACGY
jgi:hypothetical protein